MGVFAFVPGIARATVGVDVDDLSLPTPASDQTVFLEAFFTEVPPLADENLAGFNLRATLSGPGVSASGVRFAPPATTTTVHTWVFTGGGSMQDFGSDFDSLRSDGLPTSGDVDIDNNEGIARMAVVIPAGTAPGTYTVNLAADTEFTTTFFDNLGNDIAISSFQNGTITVTPEPAAFALIAGAAGLLGLRRRR
jgi:hypothetical protein